MLTYNFISLHLKQNFCYLLDAVYSRYGEEVNIVVTMFEEILHLSGGPLDTELLGIIVSFTFQYLLCEFFRNIAVEGFGTTVSWLNLAKGLMAGMIGMVTPICRAFSTKA